MNSKELLSLIEALSRDVVDASIHWTLAKDIEASIRKWPLVAPQSNTFWSLTIGAHIKTSVQALCRAYDQRHDALHLHGLLSIIQDNLQLFEEPEFRTRLKGNPFVESLAKEPRRPDPEALKREMSLCSSRDELIKRLIIHRGNAIAHASREWALSESTVFDKFPISPDEYEALIERAVHILNRYSQLFSANTYSTKIIGHDDHETIFKWIQERVEAARAKYEAGSA